MKIRPLKMIGWIGRSFVNVRGWLSLDQHVQTSTDLFNSVKNIYHVQKPTRTETFEAAMQRLNLSEADLVAKIQNFETQSLIYILFAVLVVGYGLYLFFHWYPLTGLVAFAVAAMFVIRWGQMRFWIFQVRHRKLGCSWREWWFDKKGEQS